VFGLIVGLVVSWPLEGGGAGLNIGAPPYMPP
jgi:hypothetical protein